MVSCGTHFETDTTHAEWLRGCRLLDHQVRTTRTLATTSNPLARKRSTLHRRWKARKSRALVRALPVSSRPNSEPRKLRRERTCHKPFRHATKSAGRWHEPGRTNVRGLIRSRMIARLMPSPTRATAPRHLRAVTKTGMPTPAHAPHSTPSRATTKEAHRKSDRRSRVTNLHEASNNRGELRHPL